MPFVLERALGQPPPLPYLLSPRNRVCPERAERPATMVCSRPRSRFGGVGGAAYIYFCIWNFLKKIYFLYRSEAFALPTIYCSLQCNMLQAMKKKKKKMAPRNLFLTFHLMFSSYFHRAPKILCALWNKVHASQYFLVFLHSVVGRAVNMSIEKTPPLWKLVAFLKLTR